MEKINLKSIQELWDKADNLALNYIRQQARFILQNDNNLNEFIMGMGGCFFTAKQEGLYDTSKYSEKELVEIEEDNSLQSDSALHMPVNFFQPDFMEMINELNDKFKSMGFPMRFTAHGEELNDW